MAVRAKFKLDEIRHHSFSADYRTFVFSAVCADEVEENRRFHRYTPAGRIEIVVDNPAVAEQWQLGESYYLDFTHVAAKAVAA